MDDDLELKTAVIHPKQKTLLCPYCGTEGRHFIAGDILLPNSKVPGQCPDCEEAFIIQVTDDPDRERPLMIIAAAISHISDSWDPREADAVLKIRGQIETIVTGTPGLGSEVPEFQVYRANSGKIAFEPKNNVALRVLGLLDQAKADSIIVEE